MPDFEIIRRIYGYPDSMYNCSGKSLDEWKKTGEQWPALGMFLAILGTFYLALYLPSLYVILKMKLTSHSCYRIMLVLMIADGMNIISSSWFNAYFAVIGGVFCLDPFWAYLNGIFSNFSWNFACFLYILLAINRLCVITEITRFNWIFTKFGGYILWLGAALIYAFHNAIVHQGFPFNSKIFAVIPWPFIEDFAMENVIYGNRTLEVNNFMTIGTLSIVYGMIWSFVLSRKNFRISRDEMRLLLQSILITVPTFVAALLYIYIQFFSSGSLFLCIFGYIAWQTCAGISSIVYLLMNRSIRSYYFEKSYTKHFSTGLDSNHLKAPTDPSPKIEPQLES